MNSWHPQRQACFDKEHDDAGNIENNLAHSRALLRANKRVEAATVLVNTLAKLEGNLKRYEPNLIEALKLLSYCADSSGGNDINQPKAGQREVLAPYDFRGAGKSLLNRSKSMQARYELANSML